MSLESSQGEKHALLIYFGQSNPLFPDLIFASILKFIQILNLKDLQMFHFNHHLCDELSLNPFMPTGAFNICCPRDCVSRHNGGASIVDINIIVDSALRALSTLRGLRGAPEVPPLCRETQSLRQQMLNVPVGINGLNIIQHKPVQSTNSMHKYTSLYAEENRYASDD